MTTLAVFPCRLMRYSKGSQIFMFDFDVELDRIMLANEIARNANGQRRARQVPTREPVPVDPQDESAPGPAQAVYGTV